MSPKTEGPAPSLPERLDGIDGRLDAIEARLDRLIAAGEPTRDLIAEAGPILQSLSRVAVDRFADYEARGYFAFARQLARAADGVVRTYSEDDMARFADAAVHIADTVRTLTQPEVLDLIDATGEAAHADGEPLSMWGAMRATRDPDVQRGLALVFALLRGIGQTRAETGRGTARPASPPRAARPEPERAPDPLTPTPPTSQPPPARQAAVEGGRFDADGFLLDPGIWTPDLGAQIAAHLGVTLTDAHWPVLDYARADYRATGASPNVRRIAQGAGVGVRAIYALFPRQPGKTIARIAGIPKPVGCL